jgi:hypothetical protein
MGCMLRPAGSNRQAPAAPLYHSSGSEVKNADYSDRRTLRAGLIIQRMLAAFGRDSHCNPDHGFHRWLADSRRTSM